MKQQKITTRWLKKVIKQGEDELRMYKPGSDKWLLVYEQLEIVKGWLNDEKIY